MPNVIRFTNSLFHEIVVCSMAGRDLSLGLLISLTALIYFSQQQQQRTRMIVHVNSLRI